MWGNVDTSLSATNVNTRNNCSLSKILAGQRLLLKYLAWSLVRKQNFTEN